MDLAKLYQHFLSSKGVSTDSRSISEGQLFFALSGENFNGNKFAEQALEKGANLVVVDEEIGPKNPKVILVEDSLKALQELATYHRNQLQTPIIAITGSNGKTTTKELINQVLSTQFKCHYTKGNLNNHIGVPLTLLQLEAKHELAIVEMGANHIGEIKELCQIALPDFGMITNIGKAHLEGFGSLEGVKKGKTEMYDHIKNTGGIIFYNGEDEVLEEQLDGYTERINYLPSELVAVNIETNFLGFRWKDNEVITNLTGQYNLFNIAAAICVGSYFKVSDENIVQSISEYVPTNNRSQVLVENNIEYFLDAYNANPTSMKYSLDNFFKIIGEKKILILGDMLELGGDSISEHHEILKFISENDFLKAFLVGKEFSSTKENLDPRLSFFYDIEQLKIYLFKNPIEEGSSVLLKGSRGMKLEKILTS